MTELETKLAEALHEVYGAFKETGLDDCWTEADVTAREALVAYDAAKAKETSK